MGMNIPAGRPCEVYLNGKLIAKALTGRSGMNRTIQLDRPYWNVVLIRGIEYQLIEPATGQSETVLVVRSVNPPSTREYTVIPVRSENGSGH